MNIRSKWELWNTLAKLWWNITEIMYNIRKAVQRAIDLLMYAKGKEA